MKLIDKAAVIAEIDRRINNWTIRSKHSPEGQGKDTCTSRVTELNDLLSFLDTLEVKEVDLEAELNIWRHNHFHGRRDKEASGEYLERVSQLDLAKYFFELGMAISNKTQKGG